METIFHLSVIAAIGWGLTTLNNHDRANYQAAEEQRQIEYRQQQAEKQQRWRKQREESERLRAEAKARKEHQERMAKCSGDMFQMGLIQTRMSMHDITAPQAIKQLQAQAIIDPECDPLVVLRGAYSYNHLLDCWQKSLIGKCAVGGGNTTSNSSGVAVNVRGHNRNGTWVGPHIRTWPDGNPNNNLSR